MTTLGYVYLYDTCRARVNAHIQSKGRLCLALLQNEVIEYAGLYVLLHLGIDDEQLHEAV